MNKRGANRLLAGALTIPISGVLGTAILLLRGPLVFPLATDSGWIEMVSSADFVVYQTLLVIAYVLPFAGFLALHDYLREDSRVARLSFTGLILALWGTALALPASGIVSFVTSIAGKLGPADQARIGQAVTEAVTGPGLPIGILAAVCYTIGPLLIGTAIWRNARLPKASAVLLAIHGPLVSFGFSFFPVLVLGWGLFAASGILMVLGLRREGQG